MKSIYLVLLTPLFIVAPVLSLMRYVWCIFAAPEKALHIAIGYDQLVNVALNGNPDETISSRAGRHMKTERWACWLCKFLDKLEERHCEKSIENTNRGGSAGADDLGSL